MTNDQTTLEIGSRRSDGSELTVEESIKQAILSSHGGLKPVWRDTDYIVSQYTNITKEFNQRSPDKDVDPIVVRRNLLNLVKFGFFDVDGERLFLPKPEEIPGRSTFRDFIPMRAFAMKLYINDPELLVSALKNHIMGMHGSSSASLWGVLEHGLLPQDGLIERSAIVASGEHIFGGLGINKKHVSLFQWYNSSAANYALRREEMSENSLNDRIKHLKKLASVYGEKSFISVDQAIAYTEATIAFLRKSNKTNEEKIQEILIRENFPVLYAGRVDRLKEGTREHPRIAIPRSDLRAEFAVCDGLPLSEIPIILVPNDRVSQVRQLIEIRSDASQAVPVVRAIEAYQKAIDPGSYNN